MANEHTSTSVAVIGAGITGLTSAYRLEQAGFETFVYEASDRPGGQIKSRHTDGYLLERGPHTLLGRQHLPSLVDELGLSDHLVRANDQANKRFVVRNGAPRAVPRGPVSFVTSPLLSPLAKLRLLAEPFIAAGNDDDDESLADFVTRRLGPEPLEFGVGPLVAGTFAGDAGRLSARHAFPKLVASEREHGSLTSGLLSRLFQSSKDPQGTHNRPRPDLISFDGGCQVLTDGLADQLGDTIEFDCRVFALERKDNARWVVRFRQKGKRRQKTVDAVCCTIPAHTLPEVTLRDASARATVSRPEFSALDSVYYAPVAIVAIGLRCADIAHPLDGFGMLIPRTEQRSILGTLFTSSLFDGRAPDGHALLTSFVGGARSPELAAKSGDELIDCTLGDLDDLLGLRAEPDFTDHLFWEQAIPQYEVGYGHVYDVIDQIEAGYPGLFLQGSYRDGIAVPDLVSAGYDTARRIAEWSRRG